MPAPQDGGITKYKVKYHHYNGTTTQAEYEATHAAVDLSTISTPAHPTAGYAKVGWGTSADNGTTIDTPYIKKLSFNAAGITATGIDNSTFMLTNPVDLWVVWDGFTPERIAAIMADTKEFVVVTSEQFNQLLEYANGSYTYNTFSGATIKLMTDVSATYASGGLKNFAGTIEGNKHTVTLSNGYALVTGTLTGKIKNLKASGMVNKTTISGEVMFGAFAETVGYSNAEISYCVNTAAVSFNSIFSWCGGIAGKLTSGTIKYCSNEANITNSGTSNCYAGGIVGYQDGGSVVACYNSGNNSAKTHAAGIVANMSGSSASITQCYNTGVNTTDGASKAGLVGYLRGAGITYSYTINTTSIYNSNYSSYSNCLTTAPAQGASGFTGSPWKWSAAKGRPVLDGVGTEGGWAP